MSIVFDSRPESTARLARSVTATQVEEAAADRNVGDVRAPDLVRPLDRNYPAADTGISYAQAPACSIRVFGPSATIPILRINRCTRLRLTVWPRAGLKLPQPTSAKKR